MTDTPLSVFFMTDADPFWAQMLVLTNEEKYPMMIFFSGSTVTSIRNFRNKVTNVIQKEVDSAKLKSMPPIPSIESIRLQFVPNNAVALAAARMTGKLDVIRCLQARTIRDEHMDQYWVNAITRYYKNWSVDVFNSLKDLKKCFVLFVGQDDKAKIPVGDSVPVSTSVRIKTKAIVPANGELNTNKAADHDWSYASIIPSVTLIGNIPSEYNGSFFSGGVEGNGQIHVVLRDATFQPSDVFDHCAQLFSTIKTKYEARDRDSTASPSSASDIEDGIEIGQTINAILLQTDGGPNHNITFLRTQLALVALFITLMEEFGLDHFVAIRGAPHGSWLNTVERSMSILNFGLQNLALKRAEMPPWAERIAQIAGTMKGVRDRGCQGSSSGILKVNVG